MTDNKKQIPQHLPDKLVICFYVWAWIFEDAYADLDRALRETKGRGFNCVRVDTGALLTHDQAGKRRGPIRFRPWIEDWHNVPCPLRAHEVDVLERVLELFRMADKHDMTVICTSWLYQEEYYVATAETWMNKARDFARERGLPLVTDETGAFWPPINTGIYSHPVGQRHEEILINIAIRDGYWGIMPTASMSPFMPYWNDPEVVKWLKRVNGRISGGIQ